MSEEQPVLPIKEGKSIVVLSGGQDSVTCLYKALETTEVVACVFFNYGQQHMKAELACAEWHCKKNSIPLDIIDADELNLLVKGSTALTEDQGDVNNISTFDSRLPASFVPGRNLYFLTMAYIKAAVMDVQFIWTGVCETDYSGYPDCRNETIENLNLALNLGTNKKIEIRTPLMFVDKAATFKMASDLGVLHLVIEHTHTGYTGNTEHRYEWGYGPLVSSREELDPASQLRVKGWEEFRAQYPKEYANYMEWLHTYNGSGG